MSAADPDDVKAAPEEPQPSYADKLRFEDVPEDTTRSALVMFLELVTRTHPKEILYGDKPGVIVVTFDGSPDISLVTKECQERQLDGRAYLSVSPVPVSSCILVEDLSPSTTDDTVLLHFESPRNSGGPVDNVTMTERGRCIVRFKSHTAVESVLKRIHIIDNHQVRVKLYLECLGSSGGSTDPDILELPSPIIRNLDRNKRSLLFQSKEVVDDFIERLSEVQSVFRLLRGSKLELRCTVTPKTPNPRKTIQMWPEKAEQAVFDFLGKIQVLRVDIPVGLWEEVIKELDASDFPCPPEATFEVSQDEPICIVVGVETAANELFEHVSHRVKLLKEPPGLTSTEVFKLKPFQFRLLEAKSVYEDIITTDKSVSAELDCQAQQFTIHGKTPEVKRAQSELNKLLKSIKSTKLGKVSDTQRQALNKPNTGTYIEKDFHMAEILATWEKEKDEKIIVYAFSDRDVKRAKQIILQAIHEEELTGVDNEWLNRLQPVIWGQLDKFPVALWVTPTPDGRLLVTGREDAVREAFEEFCRFLQIKVEVVRFTPARQKFVSQFCQRELQNIEGALEKEKVRISVTEEGGALSVTGTREGVAIARRKLEELDRQRILCHKYQLSDQAELKFLNSKHCSRHLDDIGREHESVISLGHEGPGLMTVEPQNKATGKEKLEKSLENTLKRFFHPKPADPTAVTGPQSHTGAAGTHHGLSERHCGAEEARSFFIYSGRKENVDKTINSFRKFVAQRPVDRTLNDDSICSLTFNQVQKIKEVGRRHDVEIDVIQVASMMNLHGDPDDVDEAMEEINHLLNAVHENQAFRRVKQVGRRQGTTVPASLPANPKPTSLAFPVSVSRIIQILVMEGQIADQQVDVIVNSTSPDLDLKGGAVSSSLLRAAGPQLQAECTQKYPKGIQPGHIAFSRGFRLPCKEVYHLALEPWRQGMEEELGSVIYYCLETADERKYTSIAFPALGTGKLGYPCDKVAQTMFRVVDSFEQVRSTLSLREVRVVIHQDQQTLQAFRDAEKRTMGASSAGNSDSVPRHEKLPAEPPLPIPQRKYSGRRQDRVFPNNAYNLDLSPSRPRSPDCASEDSFDIRGLGVEIVKGELTEQAVDVIVVAVNGQLQIEDAEDLKSKGVAVTGSYTMKCGRVMFLNVAKFGHDAEKAVTKCLKEAEARTAKTLAIPPLGADVDNAVIAAKALHKAVTKFTGDRRYVQSLRVITNDWFTCRTYVEKIRDKLDKSKSKAIEQLPPARRSPVLEARSLFVYCHRIENADSAMNRFKELAAETVIEKKITDDNIRTFSTQQIADVKEAGLRRGVEVDVSPQTGEITVRGDRDIMVDAVVEITQTVTAILGRQNQKRAAHFAASFVQWYFLEVTTTGEEQKEYGQMQNHVIEEAFSKGQKTIRLTDVENTVYVIDFDVMKEYPEENPSDTVNVIRREKLTGGMDNRVLMTLPSTWTSQASNASVAVIPLKANDQEFKEVERNLLKTQGNHNVQVKQVLRIQNPTLYQQYAAKKSQIEHQNPRIKNERTLWHGTSVDAVHNINSYGFNRSYCGKNATKFGEGVYFAVNSEYSLNRTFTPADCSGNRYMYQCKVLSGYSTAGRPEMRCLPARQGNVLYDSAVDDTLKPEMFIIFNDTQAYPEYLITFTESG